MNMLRNSYNNNHSILLLRMMNNQLNLVPAPEIMHNLIDLETLSTDVSLSRLNGKKVFFRSDYSKEAIPLQNLDFLPSRGPPYQLQEFSLQARERQVIAIDSSCVLIGETDDGSIFAGRVAAVHASRGKIKNYHRAGPFIFYMSPSAISEELKDRLPQKAIRAIASDDSLAERYIRLRLERSAQIRSARSSSDSIMLVDGALRSSLLETRNISLKELEKVCEGNFIHLLGVSKSSTLRVISNASSSLQSLGGSGSYYEVTDSLRVFYPSVEARVLVAKFSSNAPVFRVDASRCNVEEDSQVLADLKFNDIFFRGYPETLRLAHHLSVFDSSTIASIRSFLSRKFGLIRIPSDDLRATVLGKLV